MSSAGGSEITASFNGLTSHSIMGLTSVGAAAAAAASALNTAAGGAARGGRGAQLQSKGKHNGNEFRLDPGHCHHLSNPDVLIAYTKWATNQSTYLYDSEVSSRLSSLAIRLRGTLLSSWSLPRYLYVYMYNIYIYIPIYVLHTQLVTQKN